ncbi:MAG: MoaD/ThiS family protein [Flavobacteriales bacterium]
MIEIRIKYFGMVAEACGTSSEAIELQDDITVKDLRLMLQKKYKAIGNVSYKVSVNQVLAHDNARIADTAEVALLPPFAGG